MTDQKVNQFLEQTASGIPVPGGGSISALSAALGAGLTEMVANLTVKKKGYEAVEARMQDIAAKGRSLRDKLAAAVDKDANAYNDVLTAYKMPKNTEAEQEARSRAIQEAMQNAARVPMAVAYDALQVMDLAEKVIREGNRNAVSDGAVGVMMARTAALGALFNVRINLASIKDKLFVEEMTKEVEKLERRIHEREKEILSYVSI
ncbi:MAG: cyclodeaminase/cyclohydrolase family protein [Desulfobacterales bacterium]|nr:cyclodeaminase/cyclohydrolase family protein [Desulfobacterales bacterium]